MGTKITKSNVRSAIRDDKAHMDYLKRDVRDDQRAGGRYKDINQTADEKHISKLAGDIKADGHFLSKHWNHSSPLNNISMVGSAGSFDKGMYDAPELDSFNAAEFDANRQSRTEANTPKTDSTVDKEENEEVNVVNPKVVVTDTNQTTSKGEPSKIEMDGGSPNNFVDVVSGEVDGVAYGAADVDGHIAVDTATVGYDDTMNLP